MYDIGVINRTNERSVMILKKIRGSIDHHCESKFFTRSSSIPWKRYLFINFDNRIHIPYNILESNEITIKSRLKKKKTNDGEKGGIQFIRRKEKEKKEDCYLNINFVRLARIISDRSISVFYAKERTWRDEEKNLHRIFRGTFVTTRTTIEKSLSRH